MRLTQGPAFRGGFVKRWKRHAKAEREIPAEMYPQGKAGGRGIKLPGHGHPLQILMKSCGFRPQNLQGSDFSREKSEPVVAVHAADRGRNLKGASL